MKNKSKLFIAECRNMKFEFWIPFLLFGFLFLYAQLMKSEQELLFGNLQFLATPLATWWMIQAFYYFVEDEGGEVYFTYSISRRYLGIDRFFFFYSLYAALILILLASCGLFRMQVLILFLIQGYLLQAVAFFLILYVRSIVLSLGSIIIYVGINMLNSTISNSIISIYIEYGGIESVMYKSLLIFGIGTCFLYLAQRKLERFEFVS